MSELHRFSRQLVESLGAHEPAALGAPVALDDIISRVLPYRACRRLFGILNVEDYELLLVRLVAGEGGLASGTPLVAVERCRAELETGHPDPGILREMEGVTLRLHPGAIARDDSESNDVGGAIVRSYSLAEPESPPEPIAALPDAPAPAEGVVLVPEPTALVEEAPAATTELGEPAREPPGVERVEFDFVDTPALPADNTRTVVDPPGPDESPESPGDPFQEYFDAPGDESELEPDDARELDPGPPEPGPPPAPVSFADSPPRPAVPPPPAAHGEPPPRCPHCASRLPSGRPVRFCPHCGSNVVPLQCVGCGADLEPSWRHCVLCGAPAVNDSRLA